MLSIDTKRDVPYWKEKSWQCSRTGCWGKYLCLTRNTYEEAEEYSIMRNLIILTFLQMLLWWSNQRGWDRYSIWHVDGICEVLEWKPWGKNHLEDVHRWEDDIKMDLKVMEWESVGSGWGWVMGFLDHSNESFDSIKGEEFLN
jgi:hypothetical protein